MVTKKGSHIPNYKRIYVSLTMIKRTLNVFSKLKNYCLNLCRIFLECVRVWGINSIFSCMLLHYLKQLNIHTYDLFASLYVQKVSMYISYWNVHDGKKFVYLDSRFHLSVNIPGDDYIHRCCSLPHNQFQCIVDQKNMCNRHEHLLKHNCDLDIYVIET